MGWSNQALVILHASNPTVVTCLLAAMITAVLETPTTTTMTTAAANASSLGDYYTNDRPPCVSVANMYPHFSSCGVFPLSNPNPGPNNPNNQSNPDHDPSPPLPPVQVPRLPQPPLCLQP